MPHLRVFYIKIWYLRYCVQFVFGFDLTTFIALVRLVDMRSKVTTRDIEAHEQLSVDYGDSAPNCLLSVFWNACGIRRTIYDNINQYHVTSKHTSSPCTNWILGGSSPHPLRLVLWPSYLVRGPDWGDQGLQWGPHSLTGVEWVWLVSSLALSLGPFWCLSDYNLIFRYLLPVLFFAFHGCVS